MQRRARRKLTPASWLVPVTPDVLRRKMVIAREWQRVDPKFLDEDEQEFWGEIAGRQLRFDERAAFVEKLTARGASKRAMEKFLSTCAAQNPNRRLRLIALADRVSMRVERADFDDLVTLVTQAPPWEKDRAAGVRILLRAIAEGKPDAPDQILARWTWRLSRAVRKQLDRKASQEYPDAKRLLGALANSRGHRHEENAAKLVNAALEMPQRGRRRAARLRRGLHAARDAAARGSARAARHDPGGRRLDRGEPAAAEDRPVARAAPQAPQEEGPGGRSGDRRSTDRRNAAGRAAEAADGSERPAAPKKRRRRRKKPADGGNAARRRRGMARSRSAPRPNRPLLRSPPPPRAARRPPGPKTRRSPKGHDRGQTPVVAHGDSASAWLCGANGHFLKPPRLEGRTWGQTRVMAVRDMVRVTTAQLSAWQASR